MTVLSWKFGFVALAVLGALIAALRSVPRRRARRGRALLSDGQVAKKQGEAHGLITWGGVRLPEGAETSHFLCAGTTGSGKSLTIGRLMHEALAGATVGSDVRALVYDGKVEAASTLHGLGLRIPTVYLNPFDTRCSEWDMAADVTSPASALQVASIFIPEEASSSNRYFTDTARDFLREVMMTFIRRGADWRLRDLVLAMRSRTSLEAVLEETAEGRDLLELHGGDARAFHNVLSTARSRMAPLELVAALWSRANTRVSLRDWCASEMVLVLGNDDAARAAMDAVNRVLFQRASELALKQPNSRSRRTWFFLDEVREAGKLDGLSRLMTKGRSRGCCVVLGFQDIHGMKSVYGPEVALELIGQCSQKALLRMESDATAKWASATVGQFEHVDIVRSQAAGLSRGVGAVNRSETWRTADVVMPSEFQAIPPTSVESGLTGYFLTPHVGAFRRTLPLRDHLQEATNGGRVADLIERPESEQYLERWDVDDCIRLGLSTELAREQESTEMGLPALPELGAERRQAELMGELA